MVEVDITNPAGLLKQYNDVTVHRKALTLSSNILPSLTKSQYSSSIQMNRVLSHSNSVSWLSKNLLGYIWWTVYLWSFVSLVIIVHWL